MLDATDKSWRQCEPVNNVWSIESCTFGTKAEVKSPKMVSTCRTKMVSRVEEDLVKHGVEQRWKIQKHGTLME